MSDESFGDEIRHWANYADDRQGLYDALHELADEADILVARCEQAETVCQAFAAQGADQPETPAWINAWDRLDTWVAQR